LYLMTKNNVFSRSSHYESNVIKLYKNEATVKFINIKVK